MYESQAENSIPFFLGFCC